jgi:hypothetical protein
MGLRGAHFALQNFKTRSKSVSIFASKRGQNLYPFLVQKRGQNCIPIWDQNDTIFGSKLMINPCTKSYPKVAEAPGSPRAKSTPQNIL